MWSTPISLEINVQPAAAVAGGRLMTADRSLLLHRADNAPGSDINPPSVPPPEVHGNRFIWPNQDRYFS